MQIMIDEPFSTSRVQRTFRCNHVILFVKKTYVSSNRSTAVHMTNEEELSGERVKYFHTLLEISGIEDSNNESSAEYDGKEEKKEIVCTH